MPSPPFRAADQPDASTAEEHAPGAPHGRWLNVLSHLDPKYGGLSAVVPQLCASVSAHGGPGIDLAAFCAPDEFYRPTNLPASSLTVWPTSRSAWLHQRDLTRSFRETVARTDGVHIHGLWEQSTHIAARTARSLRKPYVLSAHGMLEPWALDNKKWKKRVYKALVERANVANAACLHALTHAEARNYRDFGGTAPIAVIPNGVELPDATDPELFLAQFPVLRGKRIVLFLGRIHFKKGLDILVKAWAALAGEWPDAHLVLAGPDSENSRAAIERLIHESHLDDRVLFTGMLQGAMKWSALAAAQCFVLPSYSEGLSTSVLEAMGVGVPVIVTTQCNFPEVRNHQCGWQIQSDLPELTSSLWEFLANSAQANQAMGARGRRLVQEQYNWATVAQRMGEVYRWVSGGPNPLHVDLIAGTPQ